MDCHLSLNGATGSSGHAMSSSDTHNTDPLPICPNLTATPATASPCNLTDPDVRTANPYALPWHLHLFYSVAFVAMIVIAAGGNVIVIWIVVGHRRMRTVTNYFLVNLAVADTMITVLNTSFNFVYLLSSDWPFGKLFCKFSSFVSPCAISASVFTFMVIAVDRYVVIIHPLKPRIQASSVLAVIAAVWVSSVAVAFPNLLYADTKTVYYCTTGDERVECYLIWPEEFHGKADIGYDLFLMLVNYVVPGVVLALTYARVGLELWGSQTIGERTAKHDENVKSKRKVVKMMVVVVAIFAFCWLPQHVFFVVCSFYSELCGQSWVHHLYIVIYWLAMSNSMYNPVIYCWMNARFRNGFKYVLRWLPCVKWRRSDAAGFWGYTSSSRRSTSESSTTRCSYSCRSVNRSASLRLVSRSGQAPGGCGGGGGGGGYGGRQGHHHHQHQHQMVCRFNSDGSKGVWVFQNRYPRRRNDSGDDGAAKI